MPQSGIYPGQTYRFGLFEADLARGTLTRQGHRLKLQEQPFRILSLLLQQPGQIVSRERFRQELWPEGTHVNFDGSLNAALKKLRAALQDDAENPRFIETVPRQGYRFLAPIQIINDATASIQDGQISHLGNGDKSIELRLHLRPEMAQGFAAAPYWDRERARRTQRWFDSLLLAVGILFGSWFLFFVVYPVPHPSVQRLARITNAGRIDEWGGIVSDGTRIFFLERAEGHWNLMQTSVEGGTAEKMAAPFENTRLFAISPNHSQFLIGQFTRRDEEMPLWLWPVQGGEPRRLGDAIGTEPAWSPDGTQIVYVQGGNLFTIHRDGTQMRKLVHVDGRPHSPAWSPDGVSIRFTQQAGDSGKSTIWEMTAAGYDLHAILPKDAQPQQQSTGNWTADGKYFLFSGCANFDCNLWGIRDTWSWLRRSHHEPFRLTSGPDSLHVAIPAQIGSRVFAFGFRSHRELEKIDPKTDQASMLRLDTAVSQASVSPDNQTVVYSNRTDDSLWFSRMNGGSRLPLTTAPLHGGTPRWSPDGKKILFTGLREGQPTNIYMISPDGGSLHSILPSGWEGAEADWSPNGNQLVVSMHTLRARWANALFILNPETGALRELPDSKGLQEPRWSPDGKYISAVDEERRDVLIFDLEKSEWSGLAWGGLLGSCYWAKDSSAVFYQDQLDGQESIFRADVGGHTQRVYGFGEISRGSAAHFTFSGLDGGGAFYVIIERGLTDIYALDLDLP